MSEALPLTEVTLRTEAKVRRERLRFGAPVRRQAISKRQQLAWLAPDATFALVRWRRNAYGTVSWRLFIAQAGRPGEALVAIPGVRPGAHALAVLQGAVRVRRGLLALGELERAGVNLLDISPAFWRRFQERVFQKKPLILPSPSQVAFGYARRKALS